MIVALAGAGGCPGTADTGADLRSVRFTLAHEQTMAIRADVKLPTTLNVFVKDAAGVNVLGVTQSSFPGPAYSYLYGLCGDDCRGQTAGSSARLPAGEYSVDIVADEPFSAPLQCAFTPAAATHEIAIVGNLDVTAYPIRFDSTSPWTSSNFVTSLSVYDWLGRTIQLDIYFAKEDEFSTTDERGVWTYHVLTDGSNLVTSGDGQTPAQPGYPTEVSSGRLRFGPDGELVSHEPSATEHFVPWGATSPQVLQIVFGVHPASGGGSWVGTTQHVASSAVFFVDQDGNGASIACTTPALAADKGIPTRSAESTSLTLPTAAARALVRVYGAPSGPGEANYASWACICEEAGPEFAADIPSQIGQPGKTPTGSLHLRGNLDQTAKPAASFDPNNPDATSNFSTAFFVTDSAGEPAYLTIYFSKLGPVDTQMGDSGDWTYHVLEEWPGGGAYAVASDGTETPSVVGVGLLRFDEMGRLVSNTVTARGSLAETASRFRFISYDFGSGTDAGGNGLDGVTQYAATSMVTSSSQTLAYPESCTINLPGFDGVGFRCWEALWP